MVFLCLPSCMTEREKMQEIRQVGSVVLDASEDVLKLQLSTGSDSALAQWNRSDTQGVCVLRLAAGAILEKRYHKLHDLTVFCASGNAVVEIEGQRYIIEPRDCVFIPRLQAYRILTSQGEDDFVAWLVYSPPFDGQDSELVKD